MAMARRGAAESGDFDVAVVGGGAAGIAAALAAAGRGARTLLIEAAPALGGNVTGAFVHTFCGLYHAVDGGGVRPANPGFALRFAEGLRKTGGAGEPERAGRVWVLPIDPAAVERQAAAACAAEPRLETRVACAVTRAQVGADACRLELAGAAGGPRTQVRAGVVVDTSGDGVLGALAGAEREPAPPGLRQLPSYIARLAGVPAADREGFGRLRLSVSVAGATQRRELPEGCEAVLLRPLPGSDDACLTLNIPRADAGEGSDAQARAAVEARARAQVEAIVEHLRRTRAGYERCCVAAWPRRLGVREGERLVGRALIDEAAVLAGRRVVEEVALSTWPIELWHDHRRAIWRHPAGACGVPLGALVSRSHPRLGMAGRCLSATHAALGALRVIGTALATGEAIGIAAALAAERGCTLAEIDAASVRRARDER
jgi:hypothetical protein